MLIGRNLPLAVEIADRLCGARLARPAALLNRVKISNRDGVAMLTGVIRPEGFPAGCQAR